MGARARRVARHQHGTPRCHYCGRQLSKRKKGTVDHIIPRALGGPDELWNKTLACPPCNHAKGHQTYEQFTGRPELPAQCWSEARTTERWLRSNTDRG